MAEQTRREILKLTAGTLATAQWAWPQLPAASPHKTPLFFTPEEYRLVDQLTELIIPADDHSPGARMAEVAAYIDRRLAECFEAEVKQLWRKGLKRIEALSQEMNGRPFLQATNEERIALLERMARNERNPKEPEEVFFKELKTRTVRAFYTSKVGIHREMEYKGNTYLEEFAGYDAKPPGKGG